MTIFAEHVNTENEKISIQDVMLEGTTPVKVLVIHDDDPPLGSGRLAPTLLDTGTRAWLREQLDRIDTEPHHPEGI